MKKPQKILWHILLWLIVFIPCCSSPIIIYIKNKNKFIQTMPTIHLNLHDMVWSMSVELINFIIVFYVFYFVIHNLLKRSNVNWRNIFLAISIFAAIVIEKWFCELLPAINPKGLTLANKFAAISISYCVVTVISTLIQGGISLSFKTILAYFDEKRKRKELETANLKNELNVIRSQINPHFLFNTLNNIDALISKSPDKASELLIKLSDEMRYMLYDANIEKIDIESELKFLNNYISLQKIRINHENPINISIDIDNQNERIPPLLFLPLVENAFKHGIFLNIDDTIKLHIRLKEHILDFSVMNHYNQNTSFANSHKGLGLDLVKRRFGLVFPDKHKFEVKKDGIYFTVEFSINLNEN
jgi:sensor histidine kinase YesM